MTLLITLLLHLHSSRACEPRPFPFLANESCVVFAQPNNKQVARLSLPLCVSVCETWKHPCHCICLNFRLAMFVCWYVYLCICVCVCVCALPVYAIKSLI